MRKIAVTAVALLSAVALAACGGGQVRGSSTDTPAATTGGSAGSGSPAPAGNDKPFVYAYHLDVVTDWDPATSYSNEIIAMQNIYESLTTYDASTKKVMPKLATEWSQADGGKTWTFTLRAGVKFHTGRAVDSTAAKEAIERTISLKGGPAYIWDSVDKIDTPSPTSLVFHLKYPAPLDLISSSAFAAYIYDTKAAGSGAEKDWFAKGRDAGTGPYTVDSWAKGQETELKLKAFDDYWGGWKPNQYKAIQYRVTPQVTTAWQLLQRGDVDFVDRLNPQIFAQAQQTATVKTSESPSFENLFALFNTASGPMADVKVRKAIQAAIDPEGLAAALKGAAVPASGIVPEGMIGYVAGLEGKQNLDQAKQLLADAGYGPGGKKLSLSLTYAQGDDDQQLFVTLLTSTLSQLGVDLKATPMQWSAQWDQGKSADKSKRQDIFVMYWYPDYADAYSWFINLFHSADPVGFNLTYLNEPAVDKQIDQLPALTATDKDKAQETYAALQKTLLTDLAVAVPLYVQKSERAISASVSGYTDNPAYSNVVFVYQLTRG